MGVRLRGTAVESAAGSAAAGVTYSPEILSDASSVILKSKAPRSAVTRTMAVGPVTCGAPAFFNLPTWPKQVRGKREWPYRAARPAASERRSLPGWPPNRRY